MKTRAALLLIPVAIFLIWLAYPRLIGSGIADQLVPKGLWEKRGVIGDSFGALNALFAGLGLAGLVVNLYLQIVQIRHLEAREQENELQFKRQAEGIRATALLNYYNDEMERLERVLEKYDEKKDVMGANRSLEEGIVSRHMALRAKRDALVLSMEADGTRA